MNIFVLLLICLLLFGGIGSAPYWGHSANWGWGPSGGAGIVLIIVVLVLLMRGV